MNRIATVLLIFSLTIFKTRGKEETSSDYTKVDLPKHPSACCPPNSVLVNDHCEKEELGFDIDPITFQNSHEISDPDEINENVNASGILLRPPKISYAAVGIPNCPNGAFRVVLPSKDVEKGLDNGYFKYAGDVYLPDEYCLSGVKNSNESIAVRLCNVSCGKGRLCFPKCCKWNEIVEEKDFGSENHKKSPTCVNHELATNDYAWKPPIYANPYKMVDKNSTESLRIHYQTYGFPKCNYIVLKNDKNIWFRILQDGDVKVGLQLTYRPVWLPVSSPEYCIDDVKVQFNNATVSNATDYKQILVFCNVDNFDVYILHRKLYGSLNLVSAFLLLSVLIINYLLWSTHKLSGWTIVSLFTAMFFRYLIAGIDFVVTYDGLNANRSKYCFLKGLVLQYFFLSNGSSWVVVNYDMFRTFRNLYQQMEMWTNQARLTVYLLFSWVAPAFIVLGATTVYFLQHDLPEDSKGFYEYAYMSCYSPIVIPAMYYLLVTVILNIFFFLATTLLICKHRRSVRMATLNNFGDSFKLFLKLSLLSGVFFVPLIIVDIAFSKSQTISWFWFIFRTHHFIADVYILRAFGFSSKNIEALRRKYPLVNKMMVRVRTIKSDSSISTHNLAVISSNPSQRGSRQSISGP